ncbi:MAG TPA: helix-turn-helix transcriptional regulator [Actinomycetota bacterium]|nr:helix-turn-helix transcriptional regulator [Actinomycetota bacterium]
MEAGVHTPGLMRRHADRVMPVHELIVVQTGVLPIGEEDQRFAVRRGQWVLLRAGRRHYGYEDLDRVTWFYWVCFGHGPSDSEGVEGSVLRGPQTGPVARPDRMRTLFEHLLDDQQAAILTPPAAHSYLRLLLSEILLQPSADPGKGATKLARRTAAFIAEHLTDPGLSTARIADALACNADYLGRAFRDAFNETPTDHIHRLRIDRARMLFRSTNQSIERVAAEVGFGDDRYFRRIFKRRVGLTPGQFRRLRPSKEKD